MVKIGIGSDHAGFDMKHQLVNYLKINKKVDFIDFGTFTELSVDYPDIVHKMAQVYHEKEFEYGVLLCGSGNGVSITSNKYFFIRAALCWNREIAQLSRQHNDANFLCIPARFVSYEEAVKMIEAFIATEFEGGRHLNRIKKIPPTQFI